MPQPAASFDQPVADGPDHRLAMQCPGHRLEIQLRILAAEFAPAVGIDEEVPLPALFANHELRAAPRLARRQVLADGGLRVRLAHPGEQLVGAAHLRTGLDPQQLRIEQRIQLRLEQVDDSGQRQQDHEGRDEQASVEMPAPGQRVEVTAVLFVRLHGSPHRSAHRQGGPRWTGPR